MTMNALFLPEKQNFTRVKGNHGDSIKIHHQKHDITSSSPHCAKKTSHVTF